jgi:hypothetical protein
MDRLNFAGVQAALCFRSLQLLRCVEKFDRVQQGLQQEVRRPQ